MASFWRQLPLSRADDAQLPPLLVSTLFQSNSYTIYLTDLTHIWSESLNRRALFARSHEVNTSIDPTESDQLQIFLEKLKLGVDGGRNTASAMTISSGSGRPTVTLNITVHLPGGLAPLEWPFRLTPAPQSLLLGQLTLPLLQAQHSRMQEINGLIELLKEKDHVIQKMLDKFEGQGLELGQVFPQAIAKEGRNLGRKKAAEKVKGLQVFEIGSFRESLENEEQLDAAQLLQSIYSSEFQGDLKVHTSPHIAERESNWWDGIKGQTVDLLSKVKPTASSSADKSKSTPKAATVSHESTTDDDDFQVQATPPAASQDSKRIPSRPVHDSTDEDDDLDAAPSQLSKISDSRSQRSAQHVASLKKQTKLGVLGGNVAKQNVHLRDVSSGEDEPIPPQRDTENCTADDIVDEDTTDDEPLSAKPKHIGGIGGKQNPKFQSKDEGIDQHNKPKKLGIVGGKKEAEPVDDTTDDEPELEPPPKKSMLGTLGGKKIEPPSSSDEEPAPKASKARGKLGILGGKKKTIAPSLSTAKGSLDTDESSSEFATKKKLGTIGGKGKMSAIERLKEESPVREQSVKKEETPLPEETAEEKADKKRLQLKRALEEKSKAPVKKKKKF